MAANYFIPTINGIPKLQEFCTNLMIQEQVAFACADTIILQPHFSNRLVATLPEDQARAADHAAKFRDGQGASLATSYLTAVRSIAEEVVNILQSLKPMAAILDRQTGNDLEDDQATFTDLVQSIEEMSTKFDPDSGSLLVTPKSNHDYYELTLIPAISDDVANLITSIRTANENGSQQRLDHFADLQSQLSGINEEVARGATTKIKDSVLFGFSVGSQFIGDAIEPGMIVGSVLEIAGTADEISQYKDEIQEKLDAQHQICQQIRQAATEIAGDKAELTTLTLTAAQIQEFLHCGTKALQSSGSLNDLFRGWLTQLQSLCNRAATGQPGDFFTSQINAGLSYWEDIRDSVERDLNLLAQSSMT